MMPMMAPVTGVMILCPPKKRKPPRSAQAAKRDAMPRGGVNGCLIVPGSFHARILPPRILSAIGNLLIFLGIRPLIFADKKAPPRRPFRGGPYRSMKRPMTGSMAYGYWT